MATTDTRLLRAVDLAGTLALAIQGASVAAIHNLDLLGIVALSLATALGGGVMRDIILGDQPPEALRGWPLVTTALCGGLLTYLFFQSVEEIPEAALVVVDAAGLSLLAVAGAEKALEYKLTPIAAVMMGALTGVGGFTICDILLAEVPAVLRVDFLASAALIGAALLVIARTFRVSPERAALLGGAVCFLLRVAAVWRHWQLPTAHLH